jgi:hypothetical protein
MPGGSPAAAGLCLARRGIVWLLAAVGCAAALAVAAELHGVSLMAGMAVAAAELLAIRWRRASWAIDGPVDRE